MPRKKLHPRCAAGPYFAVIVSKFNEAISERLLKGCLDEFSRHGVCDCQIRVVRVPGAFEIPVVALRLAAQKKVSAVVCLGVVVRGQTLHYDLVAQECARGVMQVSLMTQKPVVFEVLAADTVALCEARARSGDRDNKGSSAARVALEMTGLLREI